MTAKKVASTSEIPKEVIEAAQKALQAVNLDEVMNEVINVKVLHYKEVDVLDDDGDPILNPASGEPFKSRKASTRTAHIQNVVPLPIYNKVLELRNQLSSGEESDRIEIMQDCVYQIWQISEPWFTKEMFEEGVDLPQVIELFKRFFNQSRLMKNKV